MNTAFAVWENRIAPVFDVARQLYIVEVESGKVIRETQQELTDEIPAKRALLLSDLDIGTLVCGAISRPLQLMLIGYGIQVIPFIAGDLQEIIQAWLSGRLGQNNFTMPGCCRKGYHRNINQEEYFMNGRRSGGRGQGGGGGRGQGGGGGQGQGGGGGRRQGGQGQGRMGGPFAAGPSGYCVCKKCGYKEPHQRGVPCLQKKCPSCGIELTRE